MSVDLVRSYLIQNFRILTWPAVGDSKGPNEKGWPEKKYELEDYREGDRVGLLTGVEVSPGKFLHDVDIDWQPGAILAQRILPPTNFIFGRMSKRVSHCFFLLPEALPSFRYEDVNGECLLEIRGTKKDGTLGHQTMVPPSIWSKNDGAQREPLDFTGIITGDAIRQPTFLDTVVLQNHARLVAIGMILAKHFGENGFGHEVRIAWAGFLLRAGLDMEDLVVMGDSISQICHNLERHDVRLVLQTTNARLSSSDGHKTKGGPSLAKLIGNKGKAVIDRINEWLGHNTGFIKNREGVIVKDSQENIRRSLSLFDLELSYNEFSDRLLVNKSRLLEDREINSMWLRIDTEHKYRPSFTFFEKVVREIAWSNSFHPVKQYLEKLQWDGVKRIDTWLRDYGGAPEGEFFEVISAIFLVAAVRRIRQPGCKYDEMIVLESKEGLDKSTALRTLAVNDEWFSDDLPLNADSQRIVEATLGKWIIESSDLAGKKDVQVEKLKSMLSRQIDGPVRMAYAHFPIERARMFVIMGTTNSRNYLVSMTGNRRFWPVPIHKFNIELLTRDRDQLWAEACVRDQEDMSIRLPKQFWPIAAEHQEARREPDAWENAISQMLATIKPKMSDGCIRIATSDIWEILQVALPQRDRAGSARIAEIMHQLDYKRTTVTNPRGLVERGYVSNRSTILDFNEE